MLAKTSNHDATGGEARSGMDRPDPVRESRAHSVQGIPEDPAVIERLDIAPGRLLLRDARVLDLDEGALSHPRDVLIERGRILDLDPGRPAPSWSSFPCEGRTLMPGLIDCHVHALSSFGNGEEPKLGVTPARQLRRNMRAILASGVVCVRDLACPLRVMNLLRWRIAQGMLPGPRILCSGPMISCTGGYPAFMAPLPRRLAWIGGQLKQELDSPRQGEVVVQRLARRGANVIKLGYSATTACFDPTEPVPVLADEVMEAICDAAHARGLPVAAHHSGSRDLAGCLRAPIDSLEHVMLDREMTAAEAGELASSGIVSVPTMTVQENLVRFGEKLRFLESPRAAELFEPAVLARLRLFARRWEWREPGFDHRPLGIIRGNRPLLGANQRSLRRMVEAGVPICAGSDLGAMVVFPGELQDELLRLEAGGLSRLEVLRAATSHAAKLLRLEQHLGAVLPGMAADLVLLDGDPLADLRAVRRPRLVGSLGRWYRPTHAETPDFWGDRGPVLGA